MKRIKGSLRHIGIKQRLLFVSILLPITLMVICFYLYYSFSMNVLMRKSHDASMQLVAMSEEVFSLKASEYQEGLIEISDPSILKNYVQQPGNDRYKETFELNLQKNRSLQKSFDVHIYDAKGKRLYRKGNFSFQEDEIVKYQKALADKSDHWFYIQEDGRHAIVLGEVIEEQGTLIGYTFALFHEDALISSFTNISTVDRLLILDQKNQYLFGQGSSNINGTLHIDEDGMLEIDQTTYFVKEKTIVGMPWKVVNLVSMDGIMQDFHIFRNMLILSVVIILVILAFLSSLTYHSIYDPIHNILKAMHKLNEKNLDNVKVIDNGKDEIHELSENFNDLVNRIQELLFTIQIEQEQRRETQIQLLQAQINPHFLFNTLNTLRYLAILNEDKPVSEGIAALAKLLRNTIVDSNELVTIEEELENVTNYVIIQKLRFGDLFETQYNIDGDVRDCKILKFLLQPIVENSILHAFGEDRGFQILIIRVQSEGDCLKIEIGDNGKGIRNEKSPISHKKLSGIGMSNIQERIHLMYGSKYSMYVRSVVDAGTIITLRLPKIK